MERQPPNGDSAIDLPADTCETSRCFAEVQVPPNNAAGRHSLMNSHESDGNDRAEASAVFNA